MSQKIEKKDLIQLNSTIYEIPQTYRSDMRVPARVFADEQSIGDVLSDRSLWQLTNVAVLPGIVTAAYAMPDIHEGYGFPIGGVAAMDCNEGIISPGGIGYDINCGVRLMAAPLEAVALKKKLENFADALYEVVPSGVGQGGSIVLNEQQLNEVLAGGARHMFEAGYGVAQDLTFCEEQGSMNGANPDLVFASAKARGADQLGTLGSGNHFVEVQKIERIFDESAAELMGLKEGCISIMIHCGSRGLGHQVCTDYVRLMMPKLNEWAIQLPDRELACAPFTSPEGQNYFAAMQAAANFAWANRHMIGHAIRKAWRSHISKEVPLDLVYDVSHNMGKQETYTIDGLKRDLIVHRKGATRAFGSGHLDVPEKYRSIGQPVLIPGTMGTASYVLTGTGSDLAFASSCHGAGRKMSRLQAKKHIRGNALRNDLQARGIIVRCDSNQGLAEEAPLAYKDIEHVVDIVSNAGLARKVARLVPLAVIKGG